MALDFPTSPTNGQKYPQPAVVGQPVYTWDGEKWTTYADAITGELHVKKSGDTMTGTLAINPATTDAGLVLDPVTASKQAVINLNQSGTVKWQVGKQINDYFMLYSVAAGKDAFSVNPANALAVVAGDPTAALGVATKQTVDAKVAKAGDTMTGDLWISKLSPNIIMQKTAPGGQDTAIRGYGSNGFNQWSIVPGNSTAQSGGNVGSDFAIWRYADDGNPLSAALVITRSNGTVSMPGTVSTGPLTATTINASGAVSTGTLSVSGTMASSGSMSAVGAISVGSMSLLSPNGTDNTLFVRTSDCYLSFNTSSAWWTFVSGVHQLMRLQYGANDMVLGAGGHGYQAGGGSWLDASDARIKNELGEYKAGLEDVAKLRPITYTFKGNDTHETPANVALPNDPKSKEAVTVPYPNSIHAKAATEQKVYRGLIAQEVETIFPEMVMKRDGFIDGEPVTDLRDLDTTPLIFALVNSIKELKARIEVLESG